MSELMTTKVNTNLKLSSDVAPCETSYTVILFMTTSPRVISAGAVIETLYEGKADYCMIVCE